MMARIKVDLPDRFQVVTELPVLGIHVNRGGHLDNAMLLTLMSEARFQFFAHFGYSDADTEGLAAFTADVAVQYLSEAYYHEVLRFEMAARDLNKYGFDLMFRISNNETGADIARAKYGLVFVDRATKTINPIPETFKKLINP